MKINHKFKVGDKVRFISKDSPNADYFKCPVDNLEIRELTKNEYDYQVYEQDKSLSWGVNEEELELIPETYKYEVVHTETQEQWDFVCKIQNYKNINWSSYGKDSCINLTQKGYADKDGVAYGNGQAKIYSFEEWLDKFGHKSEYLKQNQQLDKFPNEGHCKSLNKDLINYLIETRGTTDSKMSNARAEGIGWNYNSYWYLANCNNSNKPKYELEQLSKFFSKKEEQWIPQVGDYVITKEYSDRYDGRILKIIKIDSNRYYYFEVFDRGYYDKTHNFSKKSISRKALPHEIPTQELSKEDLLAEAKRRFPIGCKIDQKPAYNCGLIYKITTYETYGLNGDSFYIGNVGVYQPSTNTWAEIVEEPKITKKSNNFVLPEKWYCKRTKENSKILNNWNNEKYDSYAFCEKGEGCMFSDKNYTGVDLTNYGEYKEISFEQFTKHVLNKSEVVKEKRWKEVLLNMMESTGNLPFKVTGYDEPITKKLTSSKILPIKIRNSNITESTELPKRTRIKIIKKQLLTI